MNNVERCLSVNIERSFGKNVERSLNIGSSVYTDEFGNQHQEFGNFESLGESSGYESFNIRNNSRDLSPSSIVDEEDNSSQCGVDMFCDNNNTVKSKLRKSKKRQSEPLDEQFLAELMAWKLPPDALEENPDDHEEKSQENIDLISDNINNSNSDIEKSIKIIEETYSLLYGDSSSPSVSLSSSSSLSNLSLLEESLMEEDANITSKNDTTNNNGEIRRASIGPFLESLFEHIDSALTNDTIVTRVVFSLLIRLSACPSPLLTSLLLQPDLLCQPAVRPLYQVLSSLRGKIDAILGPSDAYLVTEARVSFEFIKFIDKIQF